MASKQPATAAAAAAAANPSNEPFIGKHSVLQAAALQQAVPARDAVQPHHNPQERQLQQQFQCIEQPEPAVLQPPLQDVSQQKQQQVQQGQQREQRQQQVQLQASAAYGHDDATLPACSASAPALSSSSRVAMHMADAVSTAAATAAAAASSLPDGTAAAATANGEELKISSSTPPAQLMQLVVDHARKMRAEQSRKNKEISKANRQLLELHRKRTSLEQELQSQGLLQDFDIDNVTEQQLQTMIDRVEEEQQNIVEQLAFEAHELEQQQRLLHDLQQQDKELDTRLQQELMDHLAQLQQFMQGGMVH